MEFQDAGGNFLDDFLNSIEFLPNDVRRNFELMRELDRDSGDSIKECADTENKFLQKLTALTKRSRDDNGAIDSINLEELKSKRLRARQKSLEKIGIAEQTLELVDSRLRKLDTDLAYFETILRASGEFEVGYAEPGQDVAVKPDAFENLWILGRVIHYHQDTGVYEIADVDDSRRYNIPESQVHLLDMADSQRRLCRGEEVHAVYPDTTSFYPATVSQAPRRSAVGAEPSLIVQFIGDADELGQTPHRIVPLKHVIRPPS